MCGAGPDLVLDDADDLLDHAVDLLIENFADLGVGAAGGVACRHHRVVVCINDSSATDHPFGERRRRLVGPARGEVLRELLELLSGLGQDLGQHRIFRVEIEVETGPGHAGAIADGADRQLRERFLHEQLTHRLHNGLPLPITPSCRNLHDRALISHPAGLLLHAHPSTLHHATRKTKLDSRQVSSKDSGW